MMIMGSRAPRLVRRAFWLLEFASYFEDAFGRRERLLILFVNRAKEARGAFSVSLLRLRVFQCMRHYSFILSPRPQKAGVPRPGLQPGRGFDFRGYLWRLGGLHDYGR